MKFSRVRFSTSVVIFGDENAVGSLSTEPNESSLPVDALYSEDGFLICKRHHKHDVDKSQPPMVRAVPISKIESGDPLLNQSGDEVRRGPGRPPGSPNKATEAA